MNNLAPIAAGQAYRLHEFEYFEYDHVFRNPQSAVLRLHMKNGATVEVPATDEQMKRLLFALMSGFRQEAIAYMRHQSWI